MQEKELIERKIKDLKILNIIDIKDTPFQYMETNDANYLVCGNVRLQTTKTEQEITNWLKEKPWEAINLMTQATFYQLKKLE